ncbi:unnamed protein product [Albugo candida]|uniref:tRNA/rRNA methyltransferase SpoU type domain-containing protein n=2 Tax=Albugo candida TaxID=65357 RepID=A0A024GFR2_9STRA|nr:unnamed protein product [Albugo candida]|eukprot:CCI45527.1 unnamed protein product [Albugo candida]
MLSGREAALVAGTLVAAYAFHQSSLLYAQWRRCAYRRSHPMVKDKDHSVTAEEGALDAVSDSKEDESAVPRRIRKAETVLQQRTSRIVLILEASCDIFNQQAVLPECLGVQHVWIVEPAFYKKVKSDRRIARQSTQWISVRRFKTSEACLVALFAQGYEVWATDLSQRSISLQSGTLSVPDRLAIVMGRETDGVSETMLQAATHRVYLPIYGFTDSLNLNVATGLVIFQIFSMCPEARGQMEADERKSLRKEWYQKLVPSQDVLDRYIQSPPSVFQDLRRADDHRNPWIGARLLGRIHRKEEENRSDF